MKGVRIGNGCGFWGDNLDAPLLLAEHGQLDYLTLEYLAELTMSILALQKQRDAQAGFAGDFLDVLERLGLILQAQPHLKIITNAGGMNSLGCARRARQILDKAGLTERRIAVVSGDDLEDAVVGVGAVSGVLAEQRVREGSGGGEGCRLPLLGPAPAGQLPHGDEDPEGERDTSFVETLPEDDGQRDNCRRVTFLQSSWRNVTLLQSRRARRAVSDRGRPPLWRRARHQKGTSETCAATIRHPCASRTQVWLCRPSTGRPG